MSVLGNIVSAIFPSSHTPSGAAAAGPSATTSSLVKPSAGLAPAKPISQTGLIVSQHCALGLSSTIGVQVFRARLNHQQTAARIHVPQRAYFALKQPMNLNVATARRPTYQTGHSCVTAGGWLERARDIGDSTRYRPQSLTYRGGGTPSS